MTTYYDSDFGQMQDMDDPDVREWYMERQTQKTRRKCSCCDQVKLMHVEYDVCGQCADQLERGGDPGGY
jgi:uncharacterized paraquat-inducible protein A